MDDTGTMTEMRLSCALYLPACSGNSSSLQMLSILLEDDAFILRKTGGCKDLRLLLSVHRFFHTVDNT